MDVRLHVDDAVKCVTDAMVCHDLHSADRQCQRDGEAPDGEVVNIVHPGPVEDVKVPGLIVKVRHYPPVIRSCLVIDG